MSRGLLLVLLGVLLAPALPGPALAWGPEGHKIVCEIAWRHLSADTRAFVERIRAADNEPGNNFADSCTWADQARHENHRDTSQYHYINIAVGADDVDLERDCPAYDCVAIAIRRYSVYLARDDTSDGERAEALKFLAHFVGDLHQPLHAGHREDRGGNDIFVDWFGDRDLPDDDVNLHAVWDRRILMTGDLFYPQAVQVLDAETSAQEAERWRSLDVNAWINESYHLAVDVAYHLPEDRLLGTAYLERALPVVREQIRKAGVRLAFLVTAIADGSFPPRR